MDETENVLKACIVAHQGGVPQNELDDVYYKFAGTYIPYLSLGYKSLYEYLGTIKELVKIRNRQNELVYIVREPKIAHIAQMVEKQKKSYNDFIGSKVYSRSNNNREKGTSKRKALKDLRPRNRDKKRRKRDEKNRLIHNNQIIGRESSVEGEDFEDIDSWYDEEYSHPVNIVDKPQRLDVVAEPIVNGKLLIGDDFFLQLAIRNVGTTIFRNGPCTALNSGLCKSGQTIKECTRSLRRVEVLTSKIVIMLGAEDIYRGHSSEKMIEDMENLLDFLETRFAFSRSAITLCTIPPLANLSMDCHREQVMNLHRFNHWIKEQTNVSYSDSWSASFRYNLIDFHSKNTTVRGSTEYEFFQLDARMVSGTSNPYVLWSLRGRRLAMNLLRSGS